ncbi:hypothetical protein BGZ63DRAFT_355406, partial [Mariannaea sp. PMI_226]
LFITPVESDLPSKAADKASGATSPSRSGIRRHARPDSRERRAAMRRQMSIRDRLANPPLRQSSSLSSRGADPTFPLLNESYGPDGPRQRPFREVLRDMARSDDRNRERFEEHLHSLFTGTPLRERDSISNDLEQGNLEWFQLDSIPPSTRTRIAGLSQLSHVPDGVDGRPQSRHRPRQFFQQPFYTTRSSDPTQPRRMRENVTTRPVADMEAEEERRSALLQRLRDVNGLGDRERSLSPEVWDTLLTTLTPDPQPPSVGSSFASTVASQSAGVSSSTPLTAPEPAGATTTDQACESGCENSDTEDFDPEMPPALVRRRRRLRQEERERRRVRMQVPYYNLDGPVDQDRERPNPLTRLPSSGPPATGLNIAQMHAPRNGWVGHFLTGASDDEQVAERRSLNRESSTTLPSNLTSQGEEDWAGMLHIVRGLARREDIPDEWWAEAGLSRNLPQEGTD